MSHLLSEKVLFFWERKHSCCLSMMLMIFTELQCIKMAEDIVRPIHVLSFVKNKWIQNMMNF